MSSYYRYGNFDGNNGATASELAQSRTDEQTASILRSGVKINVMSHEEWNRRVAEAEERRKKQEAEIQRELDRQNATAKEAAIKVLTPYFAMVKRQRGYQPELAKKLKAYHDKPAGDKSSADEWKAAYAEVGRLLAAAMVAFHFQMDQSRGDDVQGPGSYRFYDAGIKIDMPQGPTLRTYLEHRDVRVSPDEVKYYETLVAKEVDLPIFILATAEDNLKRASQTEGSSLSAPKALLEFVIEDDLIRQEVVEIFLDPETKRDTIAPFTRLELFMLYSDTTSSKAFILSNLPQELQDTIYALLESDDIKNLRVTCSSLAKALPLHFDRVFISANSLNIQVFKTIANHETFRHQVTEIIWDDARLCTGPELKEDRQEDDDDEDDDAENGCPLWFRKGRWDYGDPGTYIYPKVHLGVQESWAYYKPLLDDQQQVLSSNADIEAFNYGLRRFTSLKRVTITPATHGTYWKPLYRTPMIRSFPPGLDYPLPQAWPCFDEDRYIDVLPWVSEGDDGPYQELYGVQCTAEAYRAKWRGFRLVTRALVEYEGHDVTELVIGENEVQSGLNCRLFDQWSPEYGDLVTLLGRPGFRHLDLHLFTGLLEEHDWYSYKTGLLHDALAQSKNLEYLCLRASTYISEGVPQQLTFEDEWDVVPLRRIFPVDHWPRLQHFGISQMLMDLDDLIHLLSSLPSSLRSVELNHVAFGCQERGYGDLLRAMRDVLGWRSRPAEERPEVRMVVSSLHDQTLGDGRYVEVNDAVYSYLYREGENPFDEDGSCIYPGQGGVQRVVFNPGFKAPY